MTKIIKIIGSAIFAAVMYAVPIMLACAFCFNWNGFYKLIWLIIGAGQYLCLAILVYSEAQRDE